jgi:hypothetical protein
LEDSLESIGNPQKIFELPFKVLELYENDSLELTGII